MTNDERRMTNEELIAENGEGGMNNEELVSQLFIVHSKAYCTIKM